MAKINNLVDILKLEGKRVLIRVDFNVPLNGGSISEASRIKKVLPTIKFLIKNKAKIIIISHVGRPKGKIVPELTLKPIAKELAILLNKKVSFLNETIGLKVIEKSKNISNGDILLLENLRFYKGEELNSENFAKQLAKNGDIYVNEAFSCSHRTHASISEITNHISSYAGQQLLKEINTIKVLTAGSAKPVSCIIGGSKISTKIGILTNLIKKMNNIIIVGAMANNFIKYKNYNIGQSVYEKNTEILIADVIKKAQESNCKIIIPIDVVVSKNISSKGQLKNLNEIDSTDLILDIGSKTVETIVKIIDASKTILWNGPAGYFEIDEFSNGSNKIAKKITENTKNKSLTSIAGGGDTAALINKFNYFEGFTYISTAGGAFLELLEGKILPGIKALETNERY
jgi:phosphoglycerate kinase